MPKDMPETMDSNSVQSLKEQQKYYQTWMSLIRNSNFELFFYINQALHVFAWDEEQLLEFFESCSRKSTPKESSCRGATASFHDLFFIQSDQHGHSWMVIKKDKVIRENVDVGQIFENQGRDGFKNLITEWRLVSAPEASVGQVNLVKSPTPPTLPPPPAPR